MRRVSGAGCRVPGGWLVACLLAALATELPGQSRASEKGTVSQTIAGTVITIEYHRPSVRGRDSVFGGQVEWGRIWTPGANNVTTLATTRPVRLNGQRIAAGRYGMWIEVRRDSAWVLHLYADTTRWHLPQPPRDSILLSVPLERRTADGFRETLAWEFERVRPNGAELRLHWDRTLVMLDVTLDSGGVNTTVDETVGRRYEGRWLQTSARDSTRRLHLTIRYDTTRHQLVGTDDSDDWPPARGGARWGYILVPRAEGIFAIGYGINDELAQMPGEPSMLEFTVRDGSATSYVRRDARDRITATGVREP